jgi:hypothetical protein
MSKGKNFYKALSDTGFIASFKGAEDKENQNYEKVNDITVRAMESKLPKIILKQILEFLFQLKIVIQQNMNFADS